MNQVPVPPHLMGALMNLLQSQVPLQGQAQQAAPVGVPMQGYHPQIQLPPGVGPQAVFGNWQAWQPTQPGMALAGAQQQWPAMPQQQVVHGQPPQMAAPQMSMDDLRAAVTAGMQQGHAPSGPPVGSHPRDEQTLVDALKKGRAGGLKPHQALQKLHKVNGHTEMEWKTYLVDHLERFYPMIYERRVEAPLPSASQRGHSSSSVQGHAHGSFRSKPSHSTFANGKASHASCTRPRTPDDSSRSPSSKSLPVSARPAKAAPPRGPPAPTAGRRKSELLSEHAGVHVPFLSRHVKPEPPRKPTMAQSGKIGKFTNEEKIFFIQFLRWRLDRKGPVPDCSELCQDLYVAAPHRAPSAWKRHWEIFPQLPERILAEAKQRLAARVPASAKASRFAVVASGSDEEAEQNEEEGEGEDMEESGDDGNALTDVEAPPRKRKRKQLLAPRKVTKEDIHDMARYMLERSDEWDELKTQKARWEDFTSKNTKRSFGAWMLVATGRENEIKRVVQRLRKEQVAERHDAPQPAPAASPLPKAPSSSACGRTNAVNAEQATSSVIQRRDTDSRLAVRSGSPVAKRIKQEHHTPECISLLSDSE